jgi:uncharacterized protein
MTTPTDVPGPRELFQRMQRQWLGAVPGVDSTGSGLLAEGVTADDVLADDVLADDVLADDVLADDVLADDVLIELPFAPPGRPRRFEGRDEFLAFAQPERAAFHGRLEEIRNVVIHETADPEVIVVEYELAGTVTTTGQQAAASFVGVLRARDGKVVHWREYQNVLAIAAALGRLPALVAAASADQARTC